MYTANADVVQQITSKREAFPKPLESYGLLAMYGDNVVTTEGALWRSHRKITSTSFNEKNTALVFQESINQTLGLMEQWLGPGGDGNKTIKTLEHDTMALMLHIIGYVGFGLKLLYPGQKFPPNTDPRMTKYSTFDSSTGHSMDFKSSLEGLLQYLVLLMLVPRWLLRLLPSKHTRIAIASEDNYLEYMEEFLKDKIADVKQGAPEQGMDIMGMLVRTSHGDQKSKDSKSFSLRDGEIISNAFIMMLAGHETTANTMHFTLLQLATNPEVQRLVQQDVDNIFGDADPKTWDYEQSVNPLMGSYVGACMNETLRTLPPVTEIPKKVSPSQDQALVIGGEKVILPREMHIGLVVPGVHHNPKFWPSQPSQITNADTDLKDYVPERWFRTQATSEKEVEGADSEDFGGFSGPDTSAQLFRPARGSYIPFSEGARACLGRRIAQVETVAALSAVFQKHSIELAVDEWANDEDVEKMSQAQKKELYQKAQDKARAIIEGASSLITLKLRNDAFVPIRVVPRGQERFVNWLP